jgi:hypothetical protein
MPIRTLVALLSLAVAGCTTSSEGQSEPNLIAVAATPPYIGFKVPFCPATVAVAAPLAAISQLARPWPPVPAFYEGGDYAANLRQGLNEAIIANCGPPY